MTLELPSQPGEIVFLRDPHGRKRKQFRLIRQIGSGATAQVFDMEDTATQRIAPVVGKLYTAGHRTDLEAFVKLCRDRGLHRVPMLAYGDNAQEYPVVACPMHIICDSQGRTIGISSLRLSPERFQTFDKHGVIETRLGMLSATRLCYAVRAVHERYFLVGDLSAANISIDRDGNVALIDCDSFGSMMPNEPLPTQMTLDARAPESQSAQLSQASDIFLTAYHCAELLLNGRAPFAGVDPDDEVNTVQDNIDSGRSWLFDQSILLPPYFELSMGLNELPSELAGQIAQCLSPDPAMRPHSLGPLLTSLLHAERRLKQLPCSHWSFGVKDCAECRAHPIPPSRRVWPAIIEPSGTHLASSHTGGEAQPTISQTPSSSYDAMPTSTAPTASRTQKILTVAALLVAIILMAIVIAVHISS